jgi:hypothetical protein
MLACEAGRSTISMDCKHELKSLTDISFIGAISFPEGIYVIERNHDELGDIFVP